MPRAHVHFGQALPWIKPADGLPRYHGTGEPGGELATGFCREPDRLCRCGASAYNPMG